MIPPQAHNTYLETSKSSSYHPRPGTVGRDAPPLQPVPLYHNSGHVHRVVSQLESSDAHFRSSTNSWSTRPGTSAANYIPIGPRRYGERRMEGLESAGDPRARSWVATHPSGQDTSDFEMISDNGNGGREVIDMASHRRVNPSRAKKGYNDSPYNVGESSKHTPTAGPSKPASNRRRNLEDRAADERKQDREQFERKSRSSGADYPQTEGTGHARISPVKQDKFYPPAQAQAQAQAQADHSRRPLRQRETGIGAGAGFGGHGRLKGHPVVGRQQQSNSRSPEKQPQPGAQTPYRRSVNLQAHSDEEDEDVTIDEPKSTSGRPSRMASPTPQPGDEKSPMAVDSDPDVSHTNREEWRERKTRSGRTSATRAAESSDDPLADNSASARKTRHLGAGAKKAPIKPLGQTNAEKKRMNAQRVVADASDDDEDFSTTSRAAVKTATRGASKAKKTNVSKSSNLPISPCDVLRSVLVVGGEKFSGNVGRISIRPGNPATFVLGHSGQAMKLGPILFSSASDFLISDNNVHPMISFEIEQRDVKAIALDFFRPARMWIADKGRITLQLESRLGSESGVSFVRRFLTLLNSASGDKQNSLPESAAKNILDEAFSNLTRSTRKTWDLSTVTSRSHAGPSTNAGLAVPKQSLAKARPVPSKKQRPGDSANFMSSPESDNDGIEYQTQDDPVEQSTEKPKKSRASKGKKEAQVDPTQSKINFPTSASTKSRKRDDDAAEFDGGEDVTLNTGPLRNSTRIAKAPPKVYDADSDTEMQEEELLVAPSFVPTVPRPQNPNAVLFPYPPDKATLSVNEGDRWRVMAGDFLNDTLLEFGLKHAMLEASGSKSKLDMDKDVHLFNSFFYGKISARTKPQDKDDKTWPAYNSVKKWTKNKDVFSKKMIIVPICEYNHWYLALIYNPAGVLRQYVPPPVEEKKPAGASGSRQSGRRSGGDTKAAEEDAADGDKKYSKAASSSEEEEQVESSEEDEPVEEPKRKPYDVRVDQDAHDQSLSVRVKPGQQSAGLLPKYDDLSDSSEVQNVSDVEPIIQPMKATTQVRGRVHDLKSSVMSNQSSQSIDELDVIGDRDDGGASSTRPISVPVLPSKLNGRSDDKPGAPVPLEVADDTAVIDQWSDESAPAVPAQVFSPVDQMYQQQTVSAGEVPKLDSPSGTPKEQEKEASQSHSRRPDKQILDSEDTWILTFDSLGGPHKPVERVLAKWLFFEAKDKKGIEHEMTPPKYVEAKVPQQPNFSDCGLYLVHFAQQLLEDHERTIKFIQKAVPLPMAEKAVWQQEMDEVWHTEKTNDLRKVWTGIIDSLAQDFRRRTGAGASADDNAPHPDESQDDLMMMTESQAPGGDDGRGLGLGLGMESNVGVDGASSVPTPENNNADVQPNGTVSPTLPRPPATNIASTSEIKPSAPSNPFDLKATGKASIVIGGPAASPLPVDTEPYAPRPPDSSSLVQDQTDIVMTPPPSPPPLPSPIVDCIISEQEQPTQAPMQDPVQVSLQDHVQETLLEPSLDSVPDSMPDTLQEHLQEPTQVPLQVLPHDLTRPTLDRDISEDVSMDGDGDEDGLDHCYNHPPAFSSHAVPDNAYHPQLPNVEHSVGSYTPTIPPLNGEHTGEVLNPSSRLHHHNILQNNPAGSFQSPLSGHPSYSTTAYPPTAYFEQRAERSSIAPQFNTGIPRSAQEYDHDMSVGSAIGTSSYKANGYLPDFYPAQGETYLHTSKFNPSQASHSPSDGASSFLADALDPHRAVLPADEEDELPVSIASNARLGSAGETSIPNDRRRDSATRQMPQLGPFSLTLIAGQSAGQDLSVKTGDTTFDNLDAKQGEHNASGSIAIIPESPDIQDIHLSDLTPRLDDIESKLSPRVVSDSSNGHGFGSDAFSGQAPLHKSVSPVLVPPDLVLQPLFDADTPQAKKRPRLDRSMAVPSDPTPAVVQLGPDEVRHETLDQISLSERLSRPPLGADVNSSAMTPVSTPAPTTTAATASSGSRRTRSDPDSRSASPKKSRSLFHRAVDDATKPRRASGTQTLRRNQSGSTDRISTAADSVSAVDGRSVGLKDRLALATDSVPVVKSTSRPLAERFTPSAASPTKRRRSTSAASDVTHLPDSHPEIAPAIQAASRRHLQPEKKKAYRKSSGPKSAQFAGWRRAGERHGRRPSLTDDEGDDGDDYIAEAAVLEHLQQIKDVPEEIVETVGQAVVGHGKDDMDELDELNSDSSDDGHNDRARKHSTRSRSRSRTKPPVDLSHLPMDATVLTTAKHQESLLREISASLSQEHNMPLYKSGDGSVAKSYSPASASQRERPRVSARRSARIEATTSRSTSPVKAQSLHLLPVKDPLSSMTSYDSGVRGRRSDQRDYTVGATPGIARSNETMNLELDHHQSSSSPLTSQSKPPSPFVKQTSKKPPKTYMSTSASRKRPSPSKVGPADVSDSENEEHGRGVVLETLSTAPRAGGSGSRISSGKGRKSDADDVFGDGKIGVNGNGNGNTDAGAGAGADATEERDPRPLRSTSPRNTTVEGKAKLLSVSASDRRERLERQTGRGGSANDPIALQDDDDEQGAVGGGDERDQSDDDDIERGYGKGKGKGPAEGGRGHGGGGGGGDKGKGKGEGRRRSGGRGKKGAVDDERCR